MNPGKCKKKNVNRNPNVGLAFFKDHYPRYRARVVQLAGNCEVVTGNEGIAKIETLVVQRLPTTRDEETQEK